MGGCKGREFYAGLCRRELVRGLRYHAASFSRAANATAFRGHMLVLQRFAGLCCDLCVCVGIFGKSGGAVRWRTVLGAIALRVVLLLLFLKFPLFRETPRQRHVE